MRRAAALAMMSLASCAAPLVVPGLRVGHAVRVIPLSDQARRPGDFRALPGGNGVDLGSGLVFVPRHCLPKDAKLVCFDGREIEDVEEVAAGCDEYRHEIAQSARDWVIVRRQQGAPAAGVELVKVSAGGRARVLPDGPEVAILGSRVIDDATGELLPGLIAIERGGAVPGWSGRPVEVGGRVVGFVHGVVGDVLVVVLLPAGFLSLYPRTP